MPRPTVNRPIGGQAVIEGVMIRSPERIATAVRKPDGTIVVRTTPYLGFTRRHRFLDVPILRGVVSFAEMLVIGVETLNYSAGVAADAAEESEQEKPSGASPKWLDTLVSALTTTLAFAAAFGLFFFVPLAVSDLVGLRANAFAYNLVAGVARVVLLLGYLWAIGWIPDIGRVFAYHGAEHQTIFAYEADEEITVENAGRYARFHPRCGTSFILIVVLLAVLTYALVDSAFIVITGRPQALVERFVIHMGFLPLVAGLSYEALKLSGTHRNSRFVQVLTAPGLWVQRLTTREPTEANLAAAVVAARASLGLTPSDGLPTEAAVERVEPVAAPVR